MSESHEDPRFLEAVEAVKTRCGFDDERARDVVAEFGIAAILGTDHAPDSEKEETEDPPPQPQPFSITPLSEEPNMTDKDTRAIEQRATAKEVADAEHYIFSLGHSREDAQKHAARIGHRQVLEHQRRGENPLAEE